jgi:CubicO group peptidase (beta-lactamase class C family)
MKKRQFLIIVFSVFIFFVKGQGIEQELQQILTDRQLMGMSVLAVCNDSVIYEGSFGTADYARNIPITDSTLYRMASVSKTVTATALMMLYEQGLFNLDEDINDILGYNVRNPNFKNVPITPRMLLSHTSSLQDGTGYSNFLSDTYSDTLPPKLASLLCDTGSYYTNDLWQEHAPETYFSYCNLNFGIVATLVEKLSGQRFDIFCKKNIFNPLGMTAAFNIQDLQDINNIAVLYRKSNGMWQPQADNFMGVKPQPRDLSSYVIGDNGIIFGPQGSLRVSAKDLARFMMMHMNGGIYNGVRILQDTTINLMHTAQWTYNGSNGDNYYGLFRRWGLGFQLADNAKDGDIIISGYSMKGHYGESYGLLSDMYFNEENNIGLIFITNGCGKSFDYGSYSAFYAVEEDVFSALYNYSILPCILSAGILDNPGYAEPGAFPESATGKINLRFYLPEAGVVKCSLYNEMGQQVREQELSFNTYGRKQICINKTGLMPGIYFCKVHADGNDMTLKFSVINEN